MGGQELVVEGEGDGVHVCAGGVMPIAEGLAEGFELGVAEPLGVGPFVGGHPDFGGFGGGDAEAVPDTGAGGVDVGGGGDDAEVVGELLEEQEVGGGVSFGLGDAVVQAFTFSCRQVVCEKAGEVRGVDVAGRVM